MNGPGKVGISNFAGTIHELRRHRLYSRIMAIGTEIIVTIAALGGTALGAGTTWFTARSQIKARVDEQNTRLAAAQERDERDARIKSRTSDLAELKQSISQIVVAIHEYSIALSNADAAGDLSAGESDGSVQPVEAADRAFNKMMSIIAVLNEDRAAIADGNLNGLLDALLMSALGESGNVQGLVKQLKKEPSKEEMKQLDIDVRNSFSDIRNKARGINRRIEDLMAGVPNEDG